MAGCLVGDVWLGRTEPFDVIVVDVVSLASRHSCQAAETLVVVDVCVSRFGLPAFLLPSRSLPLRLQRFSRFSRSSARSEAGGAREDDGGRAIAGREGGPAEPDGGLFSRGGAPERAESCGAGAGPAGSCEPLGTFTELS